MFLSSEKDKKPYICAIYTRISEQEKDEISPFDTIEAQRERSEQYIKLHIEQGWTVVETRYDDRNYSGGTLERPALKRLIADAKQRKFNMVIVKAIDRLTRSLKDFYDLWDVLQEAGIELASATQEFNTSSPAGRLLLDILLRFGQFEREMASERTKEKMHFRASKGLFHGGYQLLGFDFHPSEKGILTINRKEVPLVRRIFQKYVEVQSAQLVARFLNQNGYRTKTWKTKAGVQHGGKRFTKAGILTMLRNLAYIGKTGTAVESFKAKWRAIINLKLFNRVQRILQSNRVRKASISQNKHRFLLTGLVWCARCGSQMTPNPAHSKGRTYLYYKCSKVIHADKTACSVRSVPARALERLVLDRIAFLATHPTTVEAIVAQTLKAAKKNLPLLRKERSELLGQLTKVNNRAQILVKALGKKRLSFIQDELEPLEEQRAAIKQRLSEIEEKLERERQKTVSAAMVVETLKQFAEVFDHLPFERQRDLLHLVVSKISYNDRPERVVVSYHHLPDIEPPKHPKNGHFGGSSLRRFDRRLYWLPELCNNQNFPPQGPHGYGQTGSTLQLASVLFYALPGVTANYC